LRMQQAKQVIPDFPAPGDAFQLFLGDPEAFPRQARDLIPPAGSGSAPGSPLPGGHVWKTCCSGDPRANQNPFSNKTWDTCAVVGNGGILTNSSCGNVIDSAQFVIRCNLPPVDNGYGKHVGVKTDLVTANPSIFTQNYEALTGRRRPFVKRLHTYGNSLLLLPAFSYTSDTDVSLRAFYTIEESDSPIRPVFLNPEYFQSLLLFWRSQGLYKGQLSTGITMVSLALELCKDVHLYGFWPFSTHPFSFHNLTNHYFDNKQPKFIVHAMPTEFELLLQLHSQGVLRLHLGDCQPAQNVI
uniref:Alpha-2,8-sialyltransferase 8F-like n=1 Tax=Stegastes partitus TaxID=144197 RepID=A0A3B5BF52_9TELE